MAFLITTPVYSPIYQLESTDDVQGGAGQIANAQAQALGERDDFLLDMVNQASGLRIVDTTTLSASYPSVVAITPVSGTLYIAQGNLATYALPPAASVADNTVFAIQNKRVGSFQEGATWVKGDGSELIEDRVSMYGALNAHPIWARQTLILKKAAGLAVWTVIARLNDVRPGTIAGYAYGTVGIGSNYPWIRCAGVSISVAEHPRLFNILGYTYGGSGASFNVPNIPDIYTGSGLGAGQTTIQFHIHV